MSDLLVRIELIKLAAEMRVDVSDLAFLDDLSVEQLTRLRHQIGHAMFAPQEPRFKRIAAAAKLVPAGISAKAAQFTMGPQISARIAGSLDPHLAVKLAGSMKDSFLATMAPYLDPDRVGPIVRSLPQQRIVDVGHLLLERQEYVALGRFVSEVDVATALRVIERASPYDLLQAALFTDDRSMIDQIVEALTDDHLAGVMNDAVERGVVDEALTLLSSISVPTRVRAVQATAGLSESTRDALLEAVARNDVWDELLPVLGQVDHDALRRLVNVPIALVPDLLDSLVQFARSRDVGSEALPVLLALDDAHRAVLPKVASLQDQETRDWLAGLATTEEAKALLTDVLAGL